MKSFGTGGNGENGGEEVRGQRPEVILVRSGGFFSRAFWL
jgi:hypothetical protein